MAGSSGWQPCHRGGGRFYCGRQVSDASAADVDIWEESGDGRGRYEGELFLDGKKYEFELDPQTGRIFDWSADLWD